MELLRPLPSPLTPEARPYWDGVREGRLMIPKCRACGKAHMHPRVLCPFCGSRELDWIRASGRGRLHSFEIAHQILNKAFKVKTPVVLAMVELEEGPRLLTNLVNVAPDPTKIRCDMPVEVVFEKQTEEISLPMFQPLGAGTHLQQPTHASSRTDSGTHLGQATHGSSRTDSGTHLGQATHASSRTDSGTHLGQATHASSRTDSGRYK